MRCAKCGADNRPTARFCDACGAALPASPSRLAAAAPSEIGVQIKAENATPYALDGERKTVTALFADIKSSTELMEDLDPEGARALIDPALQLMIEAARRYDGYIVQSTGDGIFALFGAPIAHEEHPQRALHAALRMQERIRDYAARLRAEGRPPIEIRVGINTGEVVVRSIRTGERSTEYTPIGLTANLASRLQAIAPTGAVVISGSTARLVAGYFELKPMGPARIKGVSEPVVVYEVRGLGELRTRLQASALRGFSKFVGRAGELEQIRQVLDRAGDGHGQMVAVTGEAGVGKSRLFHEFKAIARPTCKILDAFAVSHGRNSAWMPIIDLLSDYFGIVDNDDLRTRREKIVGKVLTLERMLEDTLPYLFALLGIHEGAELLAEMDAQIRHRRTHEAITRILLCESRKQPVILVLEDLHWIDSSTQALIDFMIGTIGEARILILVNYRAGFQHTWRELLCYTEIPLYPLGGESTEEMLAALLGNWSGDELPALKRFILACANGNPLFVEEMVHALFEQGILVRNGGVRLARPLEQARIPLTLEGILAARIDALPAVEKELLQTLAVIGREFSLGLVSQVCAFAAPFGHEHGASRENVAGRMLADLQAGDFIYEEPASPDTHYMFKHALIQEVAYNSVLSDRRKLLHERIAEAIQVVFAGWLDDHLTDLAHHYGRSGNARKAAEFLKRAAGQAADRLAYGEAVEHLVAGLKLLETLPEDTERDREEIVMRSRLGQNLIPLKSPAAEEVRDAFSRVRELCQRHGDVEQLFWAVHALQFFYVLRFEFFTACELGEQQLVIAERANNPAMVAAACTGLAQTLLMMGDFTATDELCERGLAIREQAAGYIRPDVGDPRRMMLSLSSSALVILGYPVRALERIREAIALGQRFGGHAHALSLSNAALLRLRLREPNEALAIVDELAALASEHGFSMWAAQAVHLRAEAWIQLNQLERGIALLHEGAAAYEHTGGIAGLWLLTLAEAYGLVGQVEEGLAVLAKMREIAEQSQLGIATAELNRICGRLTLMTEGSSAERDAETHFETAIKIAREQRAKFFELRATTDLARLLAGQGRHGEARARLEPVYHWFTEGFDIADLKEAKGLLERLASEARDPAN